MSAQQMAQQALEKQLMKFSVVIVAALPMIILYPFIQKFFIKGIMVGAVKGQAILFVYQFASGASHGELK